MARPSPSLLASPPPCASAARRRNSAFASARRIARLDSGSEAAGIGADAGALTAVGLRPATGAGGVAPPAAAPGVPAPLVATALAAGGGGAPLIGVVLSTASAVVAPIELPLSFAAPFAPASLLAPSGGMIAVPCAASAAAPVALPPIGRAVRQSSNNRLRATRVTTAHMPSRTSAGNAARLRSSDAGGLTRCESLRFGVAVAIAFVPSPPVPIGLSATVPIAMAFSAESGVASANSRRNSATLCGRASGRGANAASSAARNGAL